MAPHVKHLLTTFNFELSFFERSILNKLYDNGTRKVSVFADSKEFIKSLTESFDVDKVQKRIASTSEFDNGYVFFDYEKMTSDEAEKKAKEAEIQKKIAEEKRIKLEKFQNENKAIIEEYASKAVAPVGYSEHHTGLAIDLCVVLDNEEPTNKADEEEKDEILE